MTNGPKLWKFSRSHDACYVDCPRRAYLTYYYGGTGIVRKGLNLEQETGSLTHAILAAALAYAKEHDKAPSREMVDSYCADAVAAYRSLIAERGFDNVDGSLELEIQRQAALAEGMARGWIRHRLPYILSVYRILAVEVEREIPFGPDGSMRILTRLDCVTERRSDQALFAGPEFKTTGWISPDYIEAWRYDSQLLSHVYDVEQTFGRKPEGVLMEFLYKGAKRKNDADGTYIYYSPFLRGYRMDDIMTGQTLYGYDAGLARKKGWEVFEPFAMGLGAWVDLLPDDVLKEQFYSAEIIRSDRELETWKRQTALRQSEIQVGVLALQGEPQEESADYIMDTVFAARLDRYCYSDQYRKKCPYLPICYGSLDDPLGSGEYVPREPHHPTEFEA